MSQFIRDVKVPDSQLAREITEFVRDTSSSLLFHHSSRVFLFGALEGNRRGLKFDPELLYAGAMFHDVGLVDGYSSATERFEVDGANAARDFLSARGITAADIDLVWTAIALHTTPGIPRHMHPIVALVTAGVEMDVLGLTYHEFSADRIVRDATPASINGFIHTEVKIMSKLTGKVAVVTGASKGIGAAIAKALAAEGASVVVNYASSKTDADAVVSAITTAGGKAIAVGGDVSKAADAKGIVDATIETFGRLDILVNNSGVYEFAPIEAFTEAQYRKQFDVNVLGVLLTTQAAARYLGEGASIINVSSVVSTITPATTAVYSGTKGAVDSITGALARELGPRKIRVNTINPGVIVTEGAQSAGVIGSDFETSAVSQTPLGRVGRPDDVASIAVFLASDDAKWLTGEHIIASGGMR